MPKGIYTRKTTVKSMIRKLDALVKKIVLERDMFCVTCGAKTNLEPGHLFTRSWYSTRWDLENVYAQCHHCNYIHEYNAYPLTNYFAYPLTNYFIEIWGRKELDKLHKLAKTVHKGHWKVWELEEIYMQLSKRWDESPKPFSPKGK